MIIDINGISVEFPFEPYQLQKEYMTKVIEALDSKQNAVLESPTGTGKTLCLLTSTLAWLLKNKAEKIANYQKNFKAQAKAVENKLDMAQPFDGDDFMNNSPNAAAAWTEGHKVVYTSRTHSQLAQAMKELKVSGYQTLRGVALGSRDQLCINDDVVKSTGTSSEKVHLCRAKVKAKLCSYHGRVEKALENPTVSEHSVLDIEDLVKVGKSCGACPYYMSKHLSGEADIVFLPYNYVLDPRLLKSFALKLENAIVILDEGHNVEKVCQDAASSQIASSDLALCLEDITHIMKLLDDDVLKQNNFGEDSGPDFTIDDCAKIKEMVLALENEVDSITQVTSQGRAVPGGKIFEILNAAKITQETFPLIMKLFDIFLEFLTQSGAGKVFARKGAGIMKLSEFLATVYGSMTKDVETWKGSVQKGYRVFFELEPEKKKTGGTTSDGWMSKSSVQTSINKKPKIINFWCFNPGFGMANLINRNVHSIILTSGTLAPLKPLISELALSANFQLENPHVIKPSQVMAKIIPSGPDGTLLNAGYNNRDNPKYIHSLGMTVRTVAVNTPNGLLVFFPSYVLMNKTREAWEASGLWKAINDVKPIFIEPKKKEEFDVCMNDYYDAVQTTRGAIFMAVLRGKVSEGLDFKDQNGRAVIVIGIPFPPYLDARVVLKQEYLEQNRTPQNQLQNGKEWYNIEATRAVNQAIGRVIRHKDDYGVILLCDHRFYNYTSGLSRWVQEHIKKPTGKFTFGPVIKELGEFFRNASRTLPAPVEVKIEPLREIDIEPDQLNVAKAKAESLRKNQIKIENSNDIYSSTESTRANFDYSKMQSFIKQEEKPKTFMSGLNKNVTAIDFNTASTSQLPVKQPLSEPSSSDYESAAKKRKIKLVPNVQQSVDATFVMNRQPVKVPKEIWSKTVSSDRNEFLQLIKATFVTDSEHYKYLLNNLQDYNNNRDFYKFWNSLMPMFKYYVQFFHIFIAMRRFLTLPHKKLFNEEVKKHFFAE